jgi:predicted RNA-binding protein YlxR (DUF448 family)
VVTLHKPVRMCVSCRERKDKSQLSRYTIQSGTLTEDKNHNQQTRGIYICSTQCLENYSKRKSKSKKKGKQQ